MQEVNQPLVNVIVPSYNAAKFICETLDSVLSQTYSNIELIVVNDGSKDDTDAVVRAYQSAKNDPRLSYFSKLNTGVSDTRNFGFARSRGEYVAFLDADDLFLPNNLAEKVKALDAAPSAGMAYSASICFGESGIIRIQEASIPTGNALEPLIDFTAGLNSPSSNLIRRRCFEAVGGFDVKLSTSADWEFWVRLSESWDVVALSEPLIKYRVHGAQMHLNIALMERDMNYAMLKLRKLGLFRGPGKFRKCLAKHAFMMSGSFYRHSRRVDKSLAYLLLSLACDPAQTILKVRSLGLRMLHSVLQKG